MQLSHSFPIVLTQQLFCILLHVTSEHRAAISEYLHSKECSRIDNTDKVPAIIDLGTCPDTGARIYDLHERREILFDDNEILDNLTGRNPFDKTKQSAPHPTWAEVKESTKSPARPNGIKGSTKLIRSCKCSCMKKIKASFCSCSICERARDVLRRYNKYRVAWHLQAAEKRKLEIIKAKRAEDIDDDAIKKYLDENSHLLQCQTCNGQCHEGTSYRTFSTSLSACMNALLCDKVHVPDLDLPSLDINFRVKPDQVDNFFIHPEECCNGVHCGLKRDNDGVARSYPKCGWDAVFQEMPVHERKVVDPTTSEETDHRICACPDEYNREGKVTWMDFIKVSFAM